MSLDIEIVREGDEWQVWTPDAGGGIIGVGITEELARKDAARQCRAIADELDPVDSLRARLAGQTLNGLTSNPNTKRDISNEALAMICAGMADAIISELSKPKPTTENK